MKCPMTSPGLCGTCGRMVRWADIQTCRPNASESPKSCRSCVHRGTAVLAANGKQVGSEGCGCTSASVASGILWWTCTLTGTSKRETQAATCENYSRSESP